jgi:predicted RNA binding protein YcfA (HicA-like mRNA interferase family)
MPKLQAIKVKVLLKKLSLIGYDVFRQKGSHMRLAHREDSGKTNLTVPMHNKDISVGLLRKIIRDADISVDSFNKLK